MKRSVVFAALFAVLLGAKGSVSAEESDEYLRSVEEGFAHLYNLDHAEAEATFRRLKEAYPEHPGPPLDLAVVLWQRELFRRRQLALDRFTSPGQFTESSGEEMPPEELRAVRENFELSRRLTESILAEHPTSARGLYYKGALLGVEASFALTIGGDKFAALRLGKESYAHHRRVVEIDPYFYDAYLTLGVYEYLVDNLPWYLKWIAVIAGFSGDEERGFRYLESAVDYGRRVSDDARVLQMVLFTREERYGEALANARTLHERYPRNYLFELNEVQLLEKMDRTEEAVDVYRSILQKLDAEVPNYQMAEEPELRLQIAERLLELGRYEISREQFLEILAGGDAEEEQRAVSHLALGRISEQEGREAEADEHYRAVLGLDVSDELQDRAERRLRASP